jgi:hypothetical protein
MFITAPPIRAKRGIAEAGGLKMEIAPIAGIHAVPLLRAPGAENSERPTLEIEATTGIGDETYSSNSQTPDRCFEEGSASHQDLEPGPGLAEEPTATGTTIDIVA